MKYLSPFVFLKASKISSLILFKLSFTYSHLIKAFKVIYKN